MSSVERDGVTKIDQERWVDEGLTMFGRVFGGATAYPRAKGIWRDDEAGGRLVRDEPVVIHSYATRKGIETAENLSELAAFSRRMGRETNQGEVGLVIGNEYFSIQEGPQEER